MTLWQTSLTYQIWVWLCDVYEDSTLHRFLAAAGRWCSGQIEESRILRPLCREGIVARSWKAEAVMVKGLRLEETEALRLLLYRVIENLEEDRTTC